MGIAYNTSIVRNGLVLHLDAANTKSYPGSGTTWTDLSGNGNTGTLTNGPTFDSASKGSLVFDGIDDSVNLNSSAQFGPDTLYFTIQTIYRSNINSVRTNPSTIYGRYRYYIDHVYSSNSARFVYVNKEWETTGIFTTNILTMSGLNAKGQWNCITTIYKKDGENATLYGYVNGVYNNSSTSSRMSSYPLANEYIGNSKHSGLNFYAFDGNVASVHIYDRELSSKEIQQNFNALRGRYGI